MQPTLNRRALAVALVLVWSCGPVGPHEPFAEPVVIEIARGASSRQIAETLETRGVIRSKWSFLWERAWNREAILMAGEYIFHSPVAVSEAFEMLVSGRVRLYPLTVPEGLNRFETAKIVEASGLATADEFLALSADPSPVRDLLPDATTLEGCLFPETYSVAKTSTVVDLLNAMLSRFRSTLEIAREGRTAELDNWQAVILASMIEKETGWQTERGLVSSVFHNRMRLGMLMQCDPTIIYGLVLEDRYRGRIYRTDLADPHPYNTYIHGGLPPGPIANPGEEALRAAFAPSESSYLYFVAKPGGGSGHAFSKTLRAHNRAVRELRRYERSMR